MWSSSVTFARPVRTLDSSLRKSSTAFSIRTRAWAIASLLFEIVLIACGSRSFRRHRRSHFFAHHRASDVSRHVHIEDDDRHLVVHAQRDGGGIHDGEAFLNYVLIRNL